MRYGRAAAALAALMWLAACNDTSGTKDLCVDDPAKTEPGACGCGVSDADANGNGVPDCFDKSVDLCPSDPAKTQAGACGCGVADTDANGNGVPDCLDANIDLCPNDPAKTVPGTCGCGTADTDADGNGVPDCLDKGVDLCPSDPNKTTAGVCGCGVSDADANGNGVPDCLDAGIDLCPNDANKTVPGVCGCGVDDKDTNGNGVPDCLDSGIDLCPDDMNKTQAGVCGCGVSDADTDGNGVPDCLDAGIDLCPQDPNKTQAGVCGCGVSDADTTGNGVPDCLDAGIDLCPQDPNKTQAGACGCGVADTDVNQNGVPDCLDGNIDLCPTDANKTEPGACGCGVADADANLDGVPDCFTACTSGATGDAACSKIKLQSGATDNGMTAVTAYLVARGNLVTDPYNTNGLTSYDQAPGGNGWLAFTNGSPIFGVQDIIGSYDYGEYSQVVDLSTVASASALDASSVPFTIGAFCTGGSWAADRNVVRVDYLDANGAVIGGTSLHDSIDAANGAPFAFCGGTVTSYPVGTRKIRYVAGTDDGEYWAGQYGGVFDTNMVFAGAIQMRISVDGGAFSSWTPFSPTKALSIPATAGTHSVAIQIANATSGVGSTVVGTVQFAPMAAPGGTPAPPAN